MSLLDTPIWEVIKGSFAPDIWVRLVPAVGETLYMTVVSSIIMLVFGLLLGNSAYRNQSGRFGAHENFIYRVGLAD